jgi:16S rRNA (uracil1498-N3)-methyltransferase
VETPRPLLELGDRLSSGQTLLFWENEQDRSLRSVIGEKPSSSSVNIVIGPESGFELLEVKALLDIGATPVSLGKRILRTETAGLVVLSILNHTWDLF